MKLRESEIRSLIKDILLREGLSRIAFGKKVRAEAEKIMSDEEEILSLLRRAANPDGGSRAELPPGHGRAAGEG